MKKTGSKRGSGYDSGLGSAVLEAPEERYAPKTESRTRWPEPAPAGALQRGYGKGKDGYRSDDEPRSGYATTDEPEEYVPRRGPFRLRFRGLPQSVTGRIVLGVVTVVMLGAFAVVCAGVRSYMLHDPRFLVGSSDDIQVTGAQHLTRDQVLSVFGSDLERNIFRASLDERKADLERLPWVEHATVMRLLPNTIRVQIAERTPVAFVRQGTQIGLVDAGGVLLDMPPDAAGDPHYSFPVLTGLSASDPLQTRAARMQLYRQFMTELGSAGDHFTDSLSEVDVSDPEDLKALIASGSTDILVHFGDEDFLKRYHEYEQNLPEWKQQYPKLASADMRYDGQIVLEMQNGAGATTAGDGNAAASGGNEQVAKVEGVAKGPAAVAAVVKAPVIVKAPVSVKAPVIVKVAKVVKPAAPKLVSATVPAVEVAAAKAPVARKPAATKPVGKTFVDAKKKPMASGMSAANRKMFAALAAAHKAALAKTAKRGGGTR